MARTRYPRRRDGRSAVCLRGNRSLLAGMGVPVDLLRGGGPHHPVPHAKRPGASPASHERWSDCGKQPTQKFIMLGASLGFIALLVVPALDHRFAWSTIPF